MAERDGYIPGVPCWVDTRQPDVDQAAAFYSGLFKWDLEDVMPPGSNAKYLMARIRGGDVGAISSGGGAEVPQAVWNTYVSVDSADEAARRVREAGGRVLAEPVDVPEAGRMAVFSDPEGATFSVWQAGRHKGSRIVNEPGAVVFNGLATRDAAAAKRFYGAVFGWETMPLDGGMEAWTLPAYGDYLEQLNPGMRAQTAEMGMPGFENVVAALNPIPGEEPDTPPHWSVTFSVEDADATAEQAVSLGGRVVVPPFDAPWVRMTVLADPAGAMFIASKFVPENRDVGGAQAGSGAEAA